jgi:hypothetical protein
VRIRRTTIAGLVAALAVLCLGARAAAPAHPGNAVTALAKVGADGTFELILRFDILAFALDENPDYVTDGEKHELLASPDARLTALLEGSRDRFAGLFELRADGDDIAFDLVAFPTTAEVRACVKDRPRRPLPIKLDAVGRALVPPGTRGITVRFPDWVGDVILTVDLPAREPIALPLRPGER